MVRPRPAEDKKLETVVLGILHVGKDPGVHKRTKA